MNHDEKRMKLNACRTNIIEDNTLEHIIAYLLPKVFSVSNVVRH